MSRGHCEIYNFLINLHKYSRRFRLLVTSCWIQKTPSNLSGRGRTTKTRRYKSNNCNAIYWNDEDEERGKKVYGKIHSRGIRFYDLATLSSDKFNMSSPIPLENQPLVCERYATADIHQTFIRVYALYAYVFHCFCILLVF